jgi:hypothetical protein
LPEDEANVVAGLVYLLCQELNYVRLPPPSLGYFEEVKSLEEQLEEEARKWLCDERPARKANKSENNELTNDSGAPKKDVAIIEKGWK